MSKEIKKLPIGFPTHSVDINGEVIKLGDTITYDFSNNTSTFVVVFEHNAFRKKYRKWEGYERPILEHGKAAKRMRLKIVK